MATKKQQRDYADIISALTDMSQKDYRDAIRISRQYRKAGRMLNRTLDRQEREFVLPSKSKAMAGNHGLEYEMA